MSSKTNSSRPARHARDLLSLLGLAVSLGAALYVAPAAAEAFTLHLEPAAALWVDQPQTDRFTPGGYFAVRPGLAIGRVVSLQGTYSVLLVPGGEGSEEFGSAHSLLAGVRLRPLALLRPERDQLGGLFTDVNIGYVRTGTLDRLGFDAGIGYGFQPAPWMSVGPVVRYNQIVQPDRLLAFDPNDAQFVTLGLDFAFGAAHKEEVPEGCPDPVVCPPQEVAAVAAPPPPAEAEGCRDYDRDGTCDVEDKCPTLIGPPATLGCPIDPCSGDPLVVLVQFPYDSDQLPPPRDDDVQTMDPVLDAVAKAIAQDPSCRVCIVGHASEEGPVDYNQTLSAGRATAVGRYLNARGLAAVRMPTVGMGARCQLVPTDTRPMNRRVEFRRLQDGESCPTECSE